MTFHQCVCVIVASWAGIGTCRFSGTLPFHKMDFGPIGQWCKSVCNEDDQWFVFEKFFHIGHTQKVSPSCVFPDEIPNLFSV